MEVSLSSLFGQAAPGLFERVRLPAGLGAVLAVSLLTCALLFAEDRRRRGAWSRRWIGAAPPEALAAIRVVVLGVCFVMVLREDLVSTARIPRSMLEVHGKGVMSLVARVPGFAAFIAGAPALLAFKVVLLGLLALGALGYRTRIVLPLCFAGYLLFGGILRQYVHFFHQGLLPLYVLFVLLFTPCADAWSLERLAREKKGLPVPPRDVPAAVYGFSRWAIFALIGLCYFSAGVSKLRLGGLLWWEAENMRSKILIAALEPKLGLPFGGPLASQPDWLLAGLGLLTLVIELGMLAAAASRRSWVVLGPALFGLHAGILVSQEILFIDLLILPIIFLQPHHLFRASTALFRDRAEARAHLRAALADSGFGPASVSASPAEPRAVEPGAPEGDDMPVRRRPHLLVYGVAAYVPLMVFAVEWYPITAWQMYAYRFPTTEVPYLDVQAQLSDGTSHRPDLEEDIGALIDRRYHWAIWSYFEEGDARSERRLDDLFQRAMDLHNAHAAPDRKIVGFVVDRRTWDRRASPSDPRGGRLLGHYAYPSEHAPATAAPP
jgi:hypothetical protein